MEALRSTKSHPTADWIYGKIKGTFPNLSLGTIYRNLRILKAQGQIQELAFGSTFDRFDGNVLPHPHFICRKCGRVYDINIPYDKELNKKAKIASNCMIDSHSIEFHGKCNNCRGGE